VARGRLACSPAAKSRRENLHACTREKLRGEKCEYKNHVWCVVLTMDENCGRKKVEVVFVGD